MLSVLFNKDRVRSFVREDRRHTYLIQQTGAHSNTETETHTYTQVHMHAHTHIHIVSHKHKQTEDIGRRTDL